MHGPVQLPDATAAAASASAAPAAASRATAHWLPPEESFPAWAAAAAAAAAARLRPCEVSSSLQGAVRNTPACTHMSYTNTFVHMSSAGNPTAPCA